MYRQTTLEGAGGDEEHIAEVICITNTDLILDLEKRRFFLPQGGGQ